MNHPSHKTRQPRGHRLAKATVALAIGMLGGLAPAQDLEDTAREQFKLHPVTTNTMHVVSNLPGGAAGVDEKLIYDNPLGYYAAELPALQLISDDIKLAVRSDCPLRRYRFQIIGKAGPNSCGPEWATCEPLTVDFRLFDECPGAGGQPIPGTEGCASSDPARTDCIPIDSEALSEIHFVIPPGETISLPSTVWLGVKMSRAGAGVILGAPALAGFSDNVLDFLGFPCNATIGIFPPNPHASYNASIYGDAACTDTFLTYQNERAASNGLNAGADVCLADDLHLLRACNMAELRIGVRDAGLYHFELRRSASGVPEGPCAGEADFGTVHIPGTNKEFLVSQAGPAVQRYTFDPPVPLPATDIFAVMTMNNHTAQWMVTGQDASIGSTERTYFVWWNDEWQLQFAADNRYAGMHISITCDGELPAGACCDVFFTDESGNSVCRNVPELNCAPVIAGPEFSDNWVDASACDTEPFPGLTEICNDGFDNNCDALVDCDDPGCESFPICLGVPTVSEWGLVIAAAFALCLGMLLFRRGNDRLQQTP